MNMNDYLANTEYASVTLLDAINKEQKEIEKIGSSIAQLKKWVEYKNNFLSDPEVDDFLHPIQQNRMFVEIQTLYSEIENKKKEIYNLEQSFSIKSTSIGFLASALLQIAKQGISIVHRGLDSCPDGKSIYGDTIKNIIWQGRNQSMHYDEGSYNNAVKNCFTNLKDKKTDDKFDLTTNSKENLAYEIVTDILLWNDYDSYHKDMMGL